MHFSLHVKKNSIIEKKHSAIQTTFSYWNFIILERISEPEKIYNQNIRNAHLYFININIHFKVPVVVFENKDGLI